jgi:UDP-glucuronate 4-epimerase
MNRILITGAAGFIGSHLSDRLLAQGHSVLGIDAFADNYEESIKRQNIYSAVSNPQFELVEIDIRNRSAMAETLDRFKPQTVVHLAALAGVRPSVEKADEFADVNITGTVHLLDAAVAAGTTRVLFGSSSSVYGNNTKVPFSETDAVDEPISPYAATKRSGELIAYAYAHLHGLSIGCLRFFTVYGPRQRPDLAIGKFMRLMQAGEPIPMFGDGSSSRDYTYVDDILDGVCAAMALDESFGIYNLGSNRPIALRALIEKIEAATGQTAHIEQRPAQPGDVRQTYADISRSTDRLGYEPKVSLDEGLANQWAWITGS